MKIGILRVGEVNSEVLDRVIENLRIAFPKAKCTLISEFLSVPSEAYDKIRGQHRSDFILRQIRTYMEKVEGFDRILGITNLDIFVPELNFVFGEAECPGRVALISLFRLKPEFYGEKPNTELFVERATKEAVHELGHTFGLAHCSNPFCVMYFSNSIFETDRKQSLFCNRCQIKIGSKL